MIEVKPTLEHEEFHKQVRLLIADNIKTKKISPEEILAILSKLVGITIALQDQNKYNKTQLIEIVSKNIELGNEEFIESIFGKTGTLQ